MMGIDFTSMSFSFGEIPRPPEKEQPPQVLSGGNIVQVQSHLDRLAEQIEKSIKRSAKLNRDIDRTRKVSEWTQSITILGFLVLLFMVAMWMIDALKSQSSSYENLSDRINQQNIEFINFNNKFDALSNLLIEDIRNRSSSTFISTSTK